MELSNEDVMLLAGGRIRCRRCSARSKRTKLRCCAPAMKGKRVCSTHGGKSIGPCTEQGKANSAKANLKHGKYTKQVIESRRDVDYRARGWALEPVPLMHPSSPSLISIYYYSDLIDAYRTKFEVDTVTASAMGEVVQKPEIFSKDILRRYLGIRHWYRSHPSYLR